MPFEMPEALAALSDEELHNLEVAGTEEFASLSASADVDDATVERMTLVADGLDAIKAEKDARRAKVEALNALKARVTPVTDPVPAVVASSPAPTPEPVATPVVVTPDPVVTPEPVAVTAAVEPVVVLTNPVVDIPENEGEEIVITAAADIPQISAGARLTRVDLAKAFHLKARTLQDHSGNVPIATIDMQFNDGYDLSELSQVEQFEAIQEMSSARTLENSLSAAGGWCAPSETIYDFFNLECATASVLRLPTFKANRGGVRWPTSSPLPASTIDWVHTEANDIAGNTKPCITIPCPVFNECRLSAHGICVTAGNLMDRAYPENHNRFINQVFLAHERNENLRKLAFLEAGSVNVTLGSTFGAASALLNALLLQAADYRDKFRMCCGALLEVVLPCWARELLRADLARQQGTLNGIGALPTNADIDGWLSAVGVSPQWVNDWQPIAGDPALLFPQELFFLIYAPGTWVEFNGGTLDLGVVRDSVLNATNDFTAAWTETFYCIGLVGYESRRVRVEVCADGSVGSRVDILCAIES